MFADKETMTDPVKEFTEVTGNKKVRHPIRFLSIAL